MKRNRKICLLISLVLLLTVILAPVAYAEDADAQTVELVEWEMFHNDTIPYLLGEGKRYEPYQGSRDFYLDPKTAYCYENTVEVDEYGSLVEGDILAPSKGAEFVWIETNYQNHIYATSKGKAALDSFLAGNLVKYTLEIDGMNAELSGVDVNKLDYAATQASGAVTVEVRSLENQEMYEIITRDTTYTFAYVHGAIYYIDNQYYYVNYETLGNHYFDADGNFSYRKGTVVLTKLDTANTLIIDKAKESLESYYTEYTYEYELVINDEAIMMVLAIAFWVIYAAIGLIPSVVLILLGVIMTIIFRKKHGGKRWLIFALLGVLWFIAALALGIAMIL